MICPKCGREIPDGTVCPCSAGAPALSSNPAVNIVKTMGSSSLLLVAVILFTASTVLNLVVSLMGGGSSGSTYFNFDLSPSNFSFSYSIGVELFALLPMIGLWLHYATCRSAQTGNISTAGLTLCKVYRILYLVFFCLAIVIFLVAGVLAIVNPNAIIDLLLSLYMLLGLNGDLPTFFVVFGVMLITVAVIAAPLVICYEVGMIRLINRTKAVATTGIPNNKMSTFILSMNWLAVVSVALAGLGSLVTSPLTGVSALVGGAALALFTISMTRYRKAMTLLMYPPIQPMYAQPVQPAQGYQAYSQPTAPVQPAAPAQPVEPVQPVAPAAPVQPAAPIETENKEDGSHE